jgi:superfamily II DNA helicase RecQ
MCSYIHSWFRGKDFRESYDHVRDVRALLMPGVPVMALTDTANTRTMNYIITKLDMDNCIVIKGTNNKKNIFYRVQKLMPCTPQDIKSFSDPEGILKVVISTVDLVLWLIVQIYMRSLILGHLHLC